MANKHSPFFPIIYVRGYAMSEGEIDDTTADPFCGFNLGSTVYRAVPEKDRPPRKYIFESPVVRLASDFKYRDVYEDGYDILDAEWRENRDNKLSSRSIVIHRYYDKASTLLGEGETPPIEQFARELSELIIRVRDLVCGNVDNGIVESDFRCYLVAHSMGGLVCRAMLQNPECDELGASCYVDKFFTYATPHNGIDFAGFNVPAWLTKFDIDNFNRGRMAQYLNLQTAYEKTKATHWISRKHLNPDRIFCMVGTNRLDYETAKGLSRTFVGHGSDGLVRIENATLYGTDDDGSNCVPCAKAFTYRSHSGRFGIVNSEEAYQNLVRFLFGDVRVDLWVDVDDIKLPEKVQRDVNDGHEVNALYQMELFAAPRGKLWFLTRRTTEEDSVACVTLEEWLNGKNHELYLSTVFLANRAKVNKDRRSLAYSMSLGVRVPDYEIDRKLWIDEHYEGGYVYRASIVIEIFPGVGGENWRAFYAFQDNGTKIPDQEVPLDEVKDGKIIARIPFDNTVDGGATTGGMRGALRFVVSGWNLDRAMID